MSTAIADAFGAIGKPLSEACFRSYEHRYPLGDVILRDRGKTREAVHKSFVWKQYEDVIRLVDFSWAPQHRDVKRGSHLLLRDIEPKVHRTPFADW